MKTTTGLVTKVFLLVLLLQYSGIKSADEASNNNSKIPKRPITDEPLKILSSDETRMIIEVMVPKFSIENVTIGKQNMNRIVIPGFSQTSEPEKPQLPLKGYIVAIPAGTTPELQILESDFSVHSDITMAMVPQQNIDPRIPGIEHSLPIPAKKSESKRSPLTSFYPRRIASLGEIVNIRGQLVCALRIFPVQYHPGLNGIRVYNTIKIQIDFLPERAGKQTSRRSFIDSDQFENFFHQNLINFSAIHNKKSVSATRGIQKVTTAHSAHSQFKILVPHDGIYLIDNSNPTLTGLNTTVIDPAKIRIFNNNTEIPIYVHGQEDGSFDDPDYIEFYGVRSRTDFTNDNVYWLTLDDTTDGLRMTIRDVACSDSLPALTVSKTQLHFEQNNVYSTSIPDGEGVDHWFLNHIIAPGSLELNVNLLNAADIQQDDCRFKIEYRGFTHSDFNPDHHTIVTLNGNQILENYWDGQIESTYQTVIPPDYFKQRNNAINISLPGDTEAGSDIIYVNWIELEYWQHHFARDDSILLFIDTTGTHQIEISQFSDDDLLLYDLTDSMNINRLMNFSVDSVADQYSLTFEDIMTAPRQYYALTAANRRIPQIIRDELSDLKFTQQQADYIIITHEDFYNSLQPLVDFRTAQGLNVKVVKITDVYDEFSHGVKNPQAIRDFLKYTFFHWQPPAPTYVLLVGDASYDYRDNLDTGHPDFVPTHLFESVYYNTETASDNWFACVVGDDNFPDMMIGRLPVASADESEIVIEKIIAYENCEYDEQWMQRLLFFADDDDEYNTFEAYSDTLVKYHIPATINTLKVYLNQYSDNVVANDDVINNLNTGCLIANYLGHGGIEFLAQEKMLTILNVRHLKNGQRQPLFVMLSCLNGFFHHAVTKNCLAETLLKIEGKGAVACYAASGFSIPGPVLLLAADLYDAIYQAGDPVFGSVIVQSKLGILRAGDLYHDHIDIFNAFGDPALSLKIPFTRQNCASLLGSVFIDNSPAPLGTKVTARVDTMNFSSDYTVKLPGQFGPMHLIADNPNTPGIDGGTDGDTISFKIISIDKDTFSTDQTTIWRADTSQQVDLIAKLIPSGVAENLSIQVSVNNRILGTDFFDGDPLYSGSIIHVNIASPAHPIDEDKIRITLNEKVLSSDEYRCKSVENDPQFDFTVSVSLNNLPNGNYNIRFDLTDSGTPAKKATTQFGFRLFSSLTLARVLNYPNPFQRSTTFTYYLVNSVPAEVQLKIYTIAGRLIKTIDHAPGEVGYNQLTWDGRDEDYDELANGVYFYKITASSGDKITEVIEKMVVMR